MPVEYKNWTLSEKEQEKYQTWLGQALKAHAGTYDFRNQQINWMPLTKPLSQTTVALVSTGGVYLKSDLPFDIDSAHGDASFRMIPSDTSTGDLAIAHSHYNHVDADRDPNCIFPLDRLRDLRDQGVIGGIAANAYSLMGWKPDPTEFLEDSIPAIVRRLKDEGARLVFITCG